MFVELHLVNVLLRCTRRAVPQEKTATRGLVNLIIIQNMPPKKGAKYHGGSPPRFANN